MVPLEITDIPDLSNELQFKAWVVARFAVLENELTNHLRHDMADMKKTLGRVMWLMTGLLLSTIANLIWIVVGGHVNVR